MKKIFLLIPLMALFLLNGCYTDTVDSFSTFIIQLPLNQDLTNHGDSKETYTPDNLNNYKEYRDNKDRIKSITIYQTAFYANEVYPEDAWDNKFKSMTFLIETSNGQRDTVGHIENVTVSDFDRDPYIDEIDDVTAKEISDRLLANPSFATISIFDPEDDEYYDRIESTLVVVIRIEVEL